LPFLIFWSNAAGMFLSLSNRSYGEMMKRETVRKILQARDNKDMYRHARGVERTAFLLAEKYGVDREKASLAGLLHDYAKPYAAEELIQIARRQCIPLDALTLREPALLHAPVGAWLLKHDLGLRDSEVLEAVRCHTTGDPKMGKLSRIVYLADAIEPGRCFAGVQLIRELVFLHGQLDRALLLTVELTIQSVLKKGRLLHSASLALRNSLVLSRRRKELEGSHEKG
jgi:predicted HD superfamily hydrolase involved in NAD metabolism